MHNHGENFLVKNGWRFSSGGEKIFLWSILFFSIRQRKNPPPRSFPFQNHNSQIEIVFTWFFGPKIIWEVETNWPEPSDVFNLYTCARGSTSMRLLITILPKFPYFNSIIWKTNSLPYFKINSGISKKYINE